MRKTVTFKMSSSTTGPSVTLRQSGIGTWSGVSTGISTSESDSSNPVWPVWAECVVCHNITKEDQLEKYSNCDFYVMPCMHMICSEACLVVLKQSVNPLACPKCKSKFNEEFIKKTTIRPLELINVPAMTKSAIEKTNVICTYCLRRDPALSWCLVCEEFLCGKCTEHHGVAYETKLHSLSGDLTGCMKSGVSSETNPKQNGNICSAHRGQELTTFCESCEVKLCNICISSDVRHVEHKLSGITQLIEETKKQMDQIVKEALNMASLCKFADRELRTKVQHVLNTEKEYLMNEAAAQFSILISTIMNREMALRKEITERTVTRAKQLNIKRAKMRSTLFRAAQFSRLAKDIRSKSSPDSMLKMRNLMTTQFAILRQQASVVTEKASYQSYVEFGNHFVMDKQVSAVAEKYIESFGTVSYTYNPNSRIHNKMYKSEESIVRAAAIVRAQAQSAAASACESPITLAQPAPGLVSRVKRSVAVKRTCGRSSNLNRSEVTKNRRKELTEEKSVHVQKPANAVINEFVEAEKSNVVNECLDEEKILYTMEELIIDDEKEYSQIEIPYEEEIILDLETDSININLVKNSSVKKCMDDNSADPLNFEVNEKITSETVEIQSNFEKQQAGTIPIFKDDLKISICENEKSLLDVEDESIQLADKIQIRNSHDNTTVPNVQGTEKSTKELSVEMTIVGSDIEKLDSNIQSKNTTVVSDKAHKVVAVNLEGDNFNSEQRGDESDVKGIKFNSDVNKRRPTSHIDVQKRLIVASDVEQVNESKLEVDTVPIKLDGEKNTVTESEDEQEVERERALDVPIRQSSSQYDDGPSQLPKADTPPRVSLQTRRRSSRIAQLHLGLRTEDESIKFEIKKAAPPVIVEKPRPDLEQNSKNCTNKRPISDSSSEKSSQRAPSLLPYLDSAYQISGKRERKGKLYPEFVSPDGRRKSTVSRDSTPKASTSKPDESSASASSSSQGQGKRKSGEVINVARKKSCQSKIDTNLSSEVPQEALDNHDLTKHPLLIDDEMKISNYDENEDYCAICRDGGKDMLLCCDHCPKVFHKKCHMPALEDPPKGEFKCFLCTSKDVACVPYSTIRAKYVHKKHLTGINLSIEDFFKACKFLSEVYKIEECLILRLAVQKLGRIKPGKVNPARLLHTIRLGLTIGEPKPFRDVEQMLVGLRKMFRAFSDLLLPGAISGVVIALEMSQLKFEKLVEEYYPDYQQLTHESE